MCLYSYSGISSGPSGTESTCQAGDSSLTVGWKQSLEREMETHCSKAGSFHISGNFEFHPGHSYYKVVGILDSIIFL